MLKKASKNQKAVFHVLLIAVIEFLWALVFQGLFHRMGWMAHVEEASFTNAIALVWQTTLFMVPAIAHLIMSLVEHKKRFFDVYGLRLPMQKKRWVPLTVGALYIAMVIAMVIVNRHKAYTLFIGLYLLIYSGLLEEFIFRGLMDEHMQHHDKQWLQWVLPALLFAIVHLAGPLACDEFQGTSGWLHAFLEIGFFFAVGIMLKYSKKVSGTLLTSVFLLSMIEFFEVMFHIQ